MYIKKLQEYSSKIGEKIKFNHELKKQIGLILVEKQRHILNQIL